MNRSLLGGWGLPKGQDDMSRRLQAADTPQSEPHNGRRTLDISMLEIDQGLCPHNVAHGGVPSTKRARAASCLSKERPASTGDVRLHAAVANVEPWRSALVGHRFSGKEGGHGRLHIGFQPALAPAVVEHLQAGAVWASESSARSRASERSELLAERLHTGVIELRRCVEPADRPAPLGCVSGRDVGLFSATAGFEVPLLSTAAPRGLQACGVSARDAA